ncbi:MAG: hypothetical protein PF549_01325, partial [Patescibacteria group bacterium]|nr:hypothetical protein [Patescibacteria group bacterium]
MASEKSNNTRKIKKEKERMKKDLSASYSDDATEREDRYTEFFIVQRRNESIYKFLRRIITEIILQVNSTFSIHELAKDLEELTGVRINLPFLLNTLIFKDSGIVITGDVVSASIASEKLSRNILKASEEILIQAGGEMEKCRLFSCVRRKTIKPLSDATISEALIT